MKIEKVQLDADQKKFLTDYVTKGTHSARSIRRARSLLLLDGGATQKQVAKQLDCTEVTIYNTVRRYKECNGDVARTLVEKPRSGQPTIVTPRIEARITALACAKNGPDGRSAWSLQLIADNLIELGYIDYISHETVRQVLKKVNSDPGSKNSGASER